MGLDFNSGGSTRHVNYGQAASLDNLPQSANGFTVWDWIRRAANGANQHVVTKDGPGGTGFSFLVDSSPSQGALRLLVHRATALTDYVSAGGEVALDTWTFVAATYDDALSPEVDIYTGTLTSKVAEVSYSTTTDGSGAHNDDSADDLYLGNLERANTNPFLGVIARAGVLNRRLTLAELERIQFATIREACLLGTVLLTDLHGTGTQADYSGNGNNGTVSGATVADHVPLRRSFARRGNLYVPYTVAAPTILSRRTWNSSIGRVGTRVHAA